MLFEKDGERLHAPALQYIKLIFLDFSQADLKTKEVDTSDINARMQVKEYLSRILDDVEDRMHVTIKRPPDYEMVRRERQQAVSPPVETSVEDVIDSKLYYHSKRNAVRLYLCKIVEDAAEKCKVNICIQMASVAYF